MPSLHEPHATPTGSAPAMGSVFAAALLGMLESGDAGAASERTTTAGDGSPALPGTSPAEASPSCTPERILLGCVQSANTGAPDGLQASATHPKAEQIEENLPAAPVGESEPGRMFKVEAPPHEGEHSRTAMVARQGVFNLPVPVVRHGPHATAAASGNPSAEFAEHQPSGEAVSALPFVVPVDPDPSSAMISGAAKPASSVSGLDRAAAANAARLPVRAGALAQSFEPEAATVEQLHMAGGRASIAFGARVIAARPAIAPEDAIRGGEEGRPVAPASAEAGRGMDETPPAAFSADAAGFRFNARSLAESGRTDDEKASGKSGAKNNDVAKGDTAPHRPAGEIASTGVPPPGIQAAGKAAPFKAQSPVTTPGAGAEEQELPSGAQPTLRDVSIKIVGNVSGDGAQTAQVRVVERAGEIQVAVRASDPRLAESLRSNVGNLVSGLARSDMSAEIWHVGSTAQEPAARDARQEPGARTPVDQQADSGSSQSGGGQRGNRDQRAPEWLEELDAIPDGRPARRNSQ